MRKRLDLTARSSPRYPRQCIELAAQAPTASNGQGWHFVVVTDPAKRQALAEYCHREGFELFTATLRRRWPACSRTTPPT